MKKTKNGRMLLVNKTNSIIFGKFDLELEILKEKLKKEPNNVELQKKIKGLEKVLKRFNQQQNLFNNKKT